jgi:type I restriction enzyme M protein
MLANPPFGTDWSKIESVVKKEHEKKGGRFDAGLPSTTDGSLLFLQHMIAKMDKSGSRIGIVLNGSPLFNGDAGSGWSNIRKSFLDNNLLDAIVALPKSLFYGTDISTYLWILDNKRPENKKNKVLFIDASDKDTFASLLQRNIGKKRFEISEKGIEKVLKLYKSYKNASIEIDGVKTEVAKLLDYDEFFYTKVAVCRPSKLKFVDFQKNLNKQWDDLPAGAKKNLERFRDEKSLNGEFYDAEFFDKIKKIIGKNVPAALAKDVRRLAIEDEDAPAIFATPGKPESGYVANTDLNDSENIPKKEDIDEYFEREVVPFVEKPWMDRSKDKIGVEFPFTKLFYVYKPLRSNEEIFADLKALEAEADADFEALMLEDK